MNKVLLKIVLIMFLAVTNAILEKQNY